MSKHTKESTLAAWVCLTPINPLKHMTPVPYKATGSRYGACGVRIDGNPAFIDAVLSHLKDLLPGENGITRLELSRSAVQPTGGRVFANADTKAEVCYIRLHMRGGEAQHFSRYDRRLVAASERYAEALES